MPGLSRTWRGFAAIGLLMLGWGVTARPALAASCSFGISTLNFGEVDTLNGEVGQGTATLSITCTNVVTGAVRICPNIGAGSGGATGAVRHMRNASNAPLDFTLSLDPGGQTLWGSIEHALLGTPPTINLTTSLFGSISTTRTIYGRIPAGQQAAAVGLYTSNFSAADVKISYSELALFNCLTLNAPVSAPFQARAEVKPYCEISADTVDFGSHGVLASAVDAVGEVRVRCTPGAAYAVTLNNGETGTGPAARRMRLGAGFITYGLYRDPARSQPWGGTGEGIGGTGSGASQALPVYGRVPQQTTPSPGTYSDVVIATVTY